MAILKKREIKKEILNSKRKKYYYKDHFLGIIFCLIIAIYSFIKYTPENNAKNFCLIFLLLSLTVIILVIFNLLSLKNYILTDNKLIFSSKLKNEKKVFLLDEIESWTEKQYKGKFDNWEELTLYFKNSKRVIISSDYYENYLDMKNEITKNKNRDFEKEKSLVKKTEKKITILLLILSILFFYWAYNSLETKNIKSTDIIILGDKTSENVKYIRRKRSSIEIKLEKYPNLIFQISGKGALNATNVENLIENIEKGDSIFIGIHKSDFKRKIAKTDSLTFGDKYFFNEYVSVESAKSEKDYYLKLSDNNRSKNENNILDFWIFTLFGLLFFSGFRYGLKNKEE